MKSLITIALSVLIYLSTYGQQYVTKEYWDITTYTNRVEFVLQNMQYGYRYDIFANSDVNALNRMTKPIVSWSFKRGTISGIIGYTTTNGQYNPYPKISKSMFVRYNKVKE